MAEVAALEYARVAATNAADAAPLTAVSLAAVAPDALASLVLVPHPAAHLLPTPAGGFHAFMRDAGLSTPETPAAACLVTRPQMALMMTPLGAPAAAFLEALNAGTPLGTAAADDGLDLATCLATLLSCGAFKAPA